jgi:maltose alpha-D-glucosyltransferase/alpha-amylase
MLAARLLESRSAIVSHLPTLAPSGLQACKTRLHGDYHLGQVLMVENDFVIIDFEGEPARDPEERRQKHSPLKDVAGMLRSFDYAGMMALQRRSIDRPQERERLAPYAEEWVRRASAAFLAGYRQAAQGCCVWPEDPAHGEALIQLFTWEKALYEVRYEMGNRPDWLGVPLRGLVSLLAGA